MFLSQVSGLHQALTQGSLADSEMLQPGIQIPIPAQASFELHSFIGLPTQDMLKKNNICGPLRKKTQQLAWGQELWWMVAQNAQWKDNKAKCIYM